MLKLLPTVVLPLFWIISHPLLAFGDWPQWRGPQRDGISTEIGLVNDFPDGPRMLWDHSFGRGFSGISAVGGLLFTMQATNAEYAVCLIAANGQEKWSVRTGSVFRDAQGGDGPRATPTLWGNRVFVLGAAGLLLALDRESGEVIWKKDLVEDLGGNLPNWGFCNSPLVVGNLLLVATGARAEGSLVGLRLEDGEVVWRTSSSGAGYASPIKLNTSPQSQVVFFTERGLESVTPDSGRKLWEYPWQTPLAANSATPVKVGTDSIFISSGYGMGSAMIRIPKAGDKPEVVWKTRDLTSSVSTPLWYQGYLYGFHDQVFECMDNRGKVLWEQRGLGMGTVIAADGKLYVLGEQGRLVIVRASGQRYQELGSARVLKGKCWTSPTLSDGVMYLRNERYIVALDLKQPTQTDGAESLRIAYITAGAAGMYCGSCMQDNVLVKALQAKGVEAVLVPTYTPVRTDLTDVSMERIFFGGINVFLQQKIPLFRHTPAFFDRMLNHPALLRWVSRFSSSTNAADLGALAVSVLRAEHGNQRKALGDLIHWLKHEFKPDVVHLTNSMFAGFSRWMKEELGCAVVCTLQGEDLFLDAMIQPYRDQARQILYERAPDVDSFVVHSQYYQQFMSEYLGVPAHKIKVVRLGLDLGDHGHSQLVPPDDCFTIGYLARVCPEKGVHLAIEAFEQFSRTVGREKTRLRIAGHLTASDKPFLDGLMEKVKGWGLQDRVSYEGELDRQQKLDFLAQLHVFSVPAPYKEPKGRYVLEALANGVPVVQPDHGAFPEMIQRTGGGLLVAPDSARSLAEGFKQMYENPSITRMMGEKGKIAVFSQYRDEDLANEILEIYRGLKPG